VKICLISFYYPPDLCAGSFRAEALVDALLEFDKEITEIEILTTTPNRYSSHEINEDKYKNKCKKIIVKRIKVPLHNSGILGQSIAFLFFAFGVFLYSKNKKWNIVVSTSSRLMSAFLGACISKNKKIPLYLDIRDLFLDTMMDILSKSILRHTLIFFIIIEKWTFNSASKINLVSRGFKDYLCLIVKDKKISFFTNGIDKIFIRNLKNNSRQDFTKNINILYAGNIGSGQALDLIIPKSANILKDNVNFTIIGDGSRRKELEENLKEQDIKNVKIIDPIDRKKLFYYYNKADILFVHLNDLSAFKKVLPSKLFEYASLQKPILAGVKGYAATFIKKEILGCELFEPCNESSFIIAFNRIIKGKATINRNVFIEKYKRTKVMNLMAKDIIKIGKDG
jgi:hypothetical protein